MNRVFTTSKGGNKQGVNVLLNSFVEVQLNRFSRPTVIELERDLFVSLLRVFSFSVVPFHPKA